MVVQAVSAVQPLGRFQPNGGQQPARARQLRPLRSHIRSMWRSWLPLGVALALAAVGIVALAVTAFRVLEDVLPPEVHAALGHVHDQPGDVAFAAVAPSATIVRLSAAPPPVTLLSSTLAETRALTRSVLGSAGQHVDALYATPEYLLRTGQQSAAADADGYIIFFVMETLHAGELPLPPRPVLHADGRAVLAEPPLVLMDAVHHRTTVVRFRKIDGAGRPVVPDGASYLELLFPAGEHGGAAALRWDLPLASLETATGRPLAAGSILALLGGLLVAMWPCLFQLTAYFIPGLAGLSMAEAQGRPVAAVRARVVRTALLFVAGIVLVYTLAGAAAGYVLQTPGGRSLFELWRRPLTIGAALLIAAMAVRMALRARAPLACQMPLFAPLERLGRSPAGTMLLGVAFATGCMTCFGAAVTLGMFTYVASTGSVALGAATLFVFSLGFAVPLVVGAALMARTLPLLDRLQRLAPALTLASSAVLLAFAALLLTDRYHLVSNRLAQLAVGG